MRRRRFIALGATLLFALPAGAKDQQGVMLPDQPSQFIFGSGSLINSGSRAAITQPLSLNFALPLG